MQLEVIEKLNRILNKNEFTEQDVVYVLSRIRKLWEFSGKSEKYNELIFYCDWALHIDIRNTSRVKGVLESVVDNPIGGHFLEFEHFKQQINLFLTEYSIVTFSNDEAFCSFRNSLIQVYSETPLILKDIKKKITLHRGGKNPHNQYGIHFSVKNFDNTNNTHD